MAEECNQSDTGAWKVRWCMYGAKNARIEGFDERNWIAVCMDFVGQLQQTILAHRCRLRDALLLLEQVMTIGAGRAQPHLRLPSFRDCMSPLQELVEV